MNKIPYRGTGVTAGMCCIFALSAPVMAQAPGPPASGDPLASDVIVVTGRPADPAVDGQRPAEWLALPADAAAIAARTPGGALVGNGVLSGQLSYRGLAGERVAGRINGQRFATGGPNAMDPPMHYAPSVLIDRIEVSRGAAPVSAGPALAGAVDARLRMVDFAKGDGAQPVAALLAQGRSVDESHAVGGIAGLATARWRLGVMASREEGNDYRFAGGEVGDTSFERTLYGVHAGFQAGSGELFAEYRRSETGPSGNPPFALDIVYFDTDFLQAGWQGDLADRLHLDVRIGHVAVRHLMDNQTVRRPAAPPATARATLADADSMTGEVALRIGSAQHNVTIGGDVELIDKQVTITNPFNPAFFIESQPGHRAERIGGFAQWRGGLGRMEVEAGVRIDRTTQSAGTPDLGSAVPMGPRTLAAAYFAGDRRASDTSVDAVLRLWLPGGGITPRLTLARKTRVPSTLERFAWLPTEASYGLADGNIYVGNPALKPEVMWSAEAGFDLATDAVTLRPTVYYRHIDDYIQGTPYDTTPAVVDTPVEMVSSASGDATPLLFRNVDARIHGMDLDVAVRLTPQLRLEGTASYARGERRDIADNLYRIAAPTARLAAIWAAEGWSLGAEIDAALDQDDVSRTNDESASRGYAVVGLFGGVALGRAIRLEAGVENLFDVAWRPHLAGRNRVGDSDVAIGARLPGPGRGGWLRLSFDL